MGMRQLAYHANCWGPLGGNAVGVTSIAAIDLPHLSATWSARSPKSARPDIHGVELFDGNLLDHAGRATIFAPSLDGAGVKLLAAYSGGNFIFTDILDQELARIARAADAAAEFGAEHLVVGGGAKRFDGLRADDHALLAEGLEKVVAIAPARGLKRALSSASDDDRRGPRGGRQNLRR